MFRFESFQPFGTRVIPGASGIRINTSLQLTRQQRFRLPETFDERDLARADVVAAAALDAIEQAVAIELLAIVWVQIPMQLLRQQESRAYLRAGAAADAGHLGAARLEIEGRGGDDAVGGFDDGQVVVRQRRAHHGTAHDQP